MDFISAWYLGCVIDIVQSAKVCLKDELRRVPILGKVWEGMGFIFLQREWNKDQENINQYCAVLNDYPVPYVVLIFCEGTRFTGTKHESSNEFARSHDLKELKHHLIPRTKGFLHLYNNLKPSLSGIYDITIRTEGAKANILNVILAKGITVHCHLRYFPVKLGNEQLNFFFILGVLTYLLCLRMTMVVLSGCINFTKKKTNWLMVLSKINDSLVNKSHSTLPFRACCYR